MKVPFIKREIENLRAELKFLGLCEDNKNAYLNHNNWIKLLCQSHILQYNEKIY